MMSGQAKGLQAYVLSSHIDFPALFGHLLIKCFFSNNNLYLYLSSFLHTHTCMYFCIIINVVLILRLNFHFPFSFLPYVYFPMTKKALTISCQY